MAENNTAETAGTEDKALFSFSIDDILAVIEKILGYFKEILAKLGILVLPEEGDYDYGNT